MTDFAGSQLNVFFLLGGLVYICNDDNDKIM